MENKKDFLIRVFGGVIIIVLLTIIAIRQPHDMIPQPIETCKQDSLQNVINELQMDLKMQSDGFDSKERRYEDVIFEYEYGIDHLKNYQPQAYREFHRILSHKENFNRQDEQENIKRLETPKW
jgi:hypothetical protein